MGLTRRPAITYKATAKGSSYDTLTFKSTLLRLLPVACSSLTFGRLFSDLDPALLDAHRNLLRQVKGCLCDQWFASLGIQCFNQPLILLSWSQTASELSQSQRAFGPYNSILKRSWVHTTWMSVLTSGSGYDSYKSRDAFFCRGNERILNLVPEAGRINFPLKQIPS